jgi:hypothetical protein
MDQNFNKLLDYITNDVNKEINRHSLLFFGLI